MVNDHGIDANASVIADSATISVSPLRLREGDRIGTPILYSAFLTSLDYPIHILQDELGGERVIRSPQNMGANGFYASCMYMCKVAFTA